MTTGELLNQESTVSNVAALIHLQNLEGTGGGSDNYFPYTDINISFTQQILSVNFDEQMLEADFETQETRVDFTQPSYSVTFDEENNDINITC